MLGGTIKFQEKLKKVSRRLMKTILEEIAGKISAHQKRLKDFTHSEQEVVERFKNLPGL